MGDAARKLELVIDREVEQQIDARSAPRASAYVCIDVFSDHNFWTGLSMNLSEGGVFIATHHAVPVGQTIVIPMMLPFEEEPIVTLGEVRWTRDCRNQDDVSPGLGVQFIGLDSLSLAKIRRFVATVREPLFFE
jgi:uncharacterized protein (TIGR02266 family)